MVYRRQDTQGHDTAVIISMLHGAGVRGHHKIKVDALLALYEIAETAGRADLGAE
jgi:hypothetical protein